MFAGAAGSNPGMKDMPLSCVFCDYAYMALPAIMCIMKLYMDCVACHSHRLQPPAELVVHILQLLHLRRLLLPTHDVM